MAMARRGAASGTTLRPDDPEGATTMARILVVANQTLGGQQLLALLQDRAEAGGELHVLVPASPDPAAWRSHDHHSDHAAARARLDRAERAFAALGFQVTGEIGDASPVEAVGDVLRERGGFDEIVISTLPSGPSRWLRMDVVSRIERAHGVAVTHVAARDAEVPTG